MVIKGHRFNEESEQSMTNTTDLSYKNPNLPAEERITDLLGRMTLEEKVMQLNQYTCLLYTSDAADEL